MRKKPDDTKVKTKEELNSSKFKALIENAYEGIVLYDASGFIQYASPSIRNFGGYNEHDLLGKRGSDFVHPEDREASREAFYKVLMNPSGSLTLIQRFISKAGEPIWSEYTLTNLLHNPDVRGIVSNFRNINDRKVAEQKAAESKRLLEVISENIIDGIFLGVPQKEFQYVNKAFLEITGYASFEEVSKVNPKHLYVQFDQWREVFNEMTKHGFVKNQRVLFKKKSGESFWVLLSISNFKSQRGKKFFVGSIRDITEQKKAEDELQRSQQLLNAVSRNITEAIYRSSRKQLIYVNDAFVKMFGYKTVDEVLKVDPNNLYAGRIRSKYLRQLNEKGWISNIEVQYRKKNGKTFWGLMSCSLVKGLNGEIFIDGAIRDVTEQREAQERLRESKEFITSINRNLSEGIFRSDGNRFHYINEAFVRMFGYETIEEMYAVSPGKLYSNENDRKEILTKLRTVGELTNQEVLYKKKTGEKFWGLVSYTVVKSKDGKVYMDGAIRDITKQKESEQQLKVSQQLLSSINKNISESIYRNVPSKGFVYVNPAFLQLFGYKSLRDLNRIKPKDLYVDNNHRKFVAKALNEFGEVRNAEVLFRNKKGQQFWGALSASEVIEDGVLYYDGAIRNITEQKKAEQELIESRNFINNVMRTVAAPIFVKDSKHRWIMFNDAFCWFMGKHRRDLLNKTDLDFVDKEEAKVFWKIDDQVLRTGDVVLNREKITLKKKQERHLLTVKSRYINEQGEKFVIGFITDITEIKKVEERINQLNANLQGVMESTNESIYALDKNFRYLAFNKNHSRMAKLLYKADIKIGDSKLDVIDKSPEEVWLKSELRRAMKGEQFVTEQRVDHQQYKSRYVQTTYNPIFGRNKGVIGIAVFVKDITEIRQTEESIKQNNATFSGVLESTEDQIIAVDKNYKYLMYNRAHQRAIRLGTKNIVKKGGSVLDTVPPERREIAKREIDRALKGKSFISEYKLSDGVVLEASYNPIADGNNSVIGVAIFMRDVTNRVRTERKLKTLNEELTLQNWQLAAQEEELKSTLEELSERNFELDQLMYKTSHDLRSPLSSILGLVNLASLDENKANYEVYLDKIEGRIRKLDEFIRSMLNYAQVNRSETNYEKIDLKALALSSVQELENLENFHEVSVSVSAKGKAIFQSDSLRVRIIFSNIISNAFKYYNADVKSYLKIKIDVNPMNATILFEDNGIGIKEEYLGRVFDMFYRATERSQGSGLGMYIVRQAIEKLKGTISIKSIYARGTIIKVVLPNR